MNDKEQALMACDNAAKDRMAKIAGVYIDAFALADGKPDAESARQTAADRFKAGLSVIKAGHDSSRALVEQTLSD